jgi:VCBS repeat-containing protein
MESKLGKFMRSFFGSDRKPVRNTYKPALEQLEAILAPSTGTGTGLLGNYYSDQNLTNLTLTRVDPTVNFSWNSSPGPSIPQYHFSARWTGQVQAQYSERYTFYTVSDDGVRLWVNGQLLINNWTVHWATQNKASITLVAGQTYDIRMDYFQNAGVAVAKLLWSSPSTSLEVIPTTQLYPTASWLSSDIGSPAQPGTAAVSGSSYLTPAAGSSYSIQGGGAGLGNNLDQAHYVYQPLNGDGSIVAQVNSIQSSTSNVQAGVMIRATLDGNSADADLVISPAGGATFQSRSSTGAVANQVTLPGVGIPTWLELVRNGNIIDAYVSTTGAYGTWTLVGTATIPMAATVDFGLVVSSDNNTLLSTATFSNVTVDDLTVVTPQSQSVSENGSASGNVLTGAVDSEGAAISAVVVSNQATAHGTVSIASNGSYTYTPTPGYFGSDSFSFTAQTSDEATSGTINVTVNQVNDLTVVTPQSQSVSENGSVSGNVLTGAVDSEGAAISAVVVSNQATAHGTVSIASNGSYTYTPTPGYLGSDSFTFTVQTSDESTPGTVNVTVAPNIPLGANLDAVRDYSLDNAFVDMINQARQFTSIARSTPGNYVPATVDANGWPTEDFETIVQTGILNTGHIYDGTYKLSFTGQATVTTSVTPGGAVSNVVYNPLTNTTTADVLLNASDSLNQWYFILDFRNTNGGVKNIKLIRPGYDPNTTQVFTNQFLNTLQPFSTLRFMDWAQTNNNPDVNWADRSHVTDARQSTTNGVAWEYIIELANVTHKDLWINIPVNATDDYVTQLATLLKNTLDPDLVVYVEYSNELWNAQFTQTAVNKNAAVAEVVAGMSSGTPSNLFYPGETARNPDGTYVHQWDWAFRRIARRIKQISDDFALVWGSSAINNQIRPVLASQFANPSILKAQLQFLQQTYGPPNQYIYAVAGAPYFNLNGQDQQTNLTVDQVLAALSASMTQQIATMPLYASLATYYGLRDFAYEGGPDTSGPNNIAAKAAASLDPRMENLVIQYLDAWFANGGDLFDWFVAGPTNYNTAYGTWGVTNDITNLNTPKMQGILAVLNSPKPALTAGYAVPGTISANNYVGAAPTTNPYPRYLHNGATLDYLIRAPQAGTYTLQINYAAPLPNEVIQVIVNDQVVQTLTLPVTGQSYDSMAAPDSFANSPPITLNLNEGLNVVRLKVIVEGYTINALTFTSAGP